MSIKEITEWYEEKEKFKKEFYNRKKYLTIIDKVFNKYMDNDNENWDFDIDELFSFLYDNALSLSADIDEEDFEEVFVKYKEKYLKLFEIHGQGCFRSISTTTEEPEAYIKYEDIIKYYETKEKPYRTYIMEIVSRGLNTLSTALQSETIEINEVSISFKEVMEYLSKNLN